MRSRFKGETTRKLRDLYEGEEMPADRLQLLLGLVMEHPPELPALAAWTEEQRHEVANWALRVHLRASDNNNLVPPRPALLDVPR